MKNVRFTLLLAFSLYLVIHKASAQWSSDPTVNTPICVSYTQQNSSRIVSDGKGGAIISWWNYNSETNDYNIYAQRINSKGIIKWASDGIAVCTNPALQNVPEMVSDGKGGAIITWFDQRNVNDDIYVQRIDSNGVAQWTANGVVVCDTINDQASPKLLSDGNGGAYITWEDMRNGTSYEPYVQKLNAAGEVQWTKNGVALTGGSGSSVQIISDDNGGAIIAWEVYTGSYPNGNHDIYAQQINSAGALGGGQTGLSICS